MRIESPSSRQIPQLLQLWKEVFGEYGTFWEDFLETAFSPARCRCVLEGDRVAAALCWLDGEYAGQRLAYLYAVVTAPAYRGQGLCRRLMADTHRLLAQQGYAGALLVPAEDSLRDMYQKMGYADATTVWEFSARPGAAPVPLRAIGPEEFARLRRSFLPAGGVLQEGENLRFLARQAQFYAGADFLMTAYTEGDTLHALELLGNAQAAPGILTALGCNEGTFRTPGQERAFAMFHPLAPDVQPPAYFGFEFD